jgi:UTP--glucose-1-phosphate uridylyltransferase
MTTAITKAVFPVAGLGTRFLPATKANPKEMLTVVDKPLIQYAVEEAVAAGIKELIFVTSANKRAIEDHFDRNRELENALVAKGKDGLLQMVRDTVPEGVTCVYVRQPEPLGLGHAVLCAAPIVGDDPFVVLLADDLITCEDGRGATSEMVGVYVAQGGSVLGVEDVDPSETDRYGIANVDTQSDTLGKVTQLVEKPKPAEAKSTLAVVGRYVLSPRIFHHLKTTPRGAGGEIQLTDAIVALMQEESVFTHRFRGRRFDCGSKLGFLEATVELGLRHPEIGTAFREYLRAQVAR